MSSYRVEPLEYLKQTSLKWVPAQIIKIKQDLNIINYNKLSDIDDYLILVAFTHSSWEWVGKIGEMLQEKFSNVQINFYTGGNYPTPPDILKKAAKESDLIIGATGD